VVSWERVSGPEMSSVAPRTEEPALLTRMSMWPWMERALARVRVRRGGWGGYVEREEGAALAGYEGDEVGGRGGVARGCYYMVARVEDMLGEGGAET
jgi:hypothetical protein